MAAKEVKTHGERTCTVEVSPVEVDAGTEFTVTVRAACTEGCDLSGRSIAIQDHNGAELASAELSESDDEEYTSAFVLRAPLTAAEYIWRAVLPASEKDGVLHEETSTEFSFISKAHTTSVNVWDVPSAIAAGERFAFSVGIKCSAECELTGRQLCVLDEDDEQVAAGSLGDIWPGTSALYFAEVEAQAPPTPGSHHWRIECPACDSGAPHAAGSCALTVRVVPPPDHEVTVEAFDSETQAPIVGAHVLLHPYRALTDDKGIARVKVAKGSYTLYVSGFKYIAYEGIIDVVADISARAALTAEPEGEDDYP
jgi:hypothetical protein